MKKLFRSSPVVKFLIKKTCTFQLYVTDKLLGLRLTVEQELLGSDDYEHGITQGGRFADLNNTRSTSAASSHRDKNKKKTSKSLHEGLITVGI